MTPQNPQSLFPVRAKPPPVPSVPPAAGAPAGPPGPANPHPPDWPPRPATSTGRPPLAPPSDDDGVFELWAGDLLPSPGGAGDLPGGDDAFGHPASGPGVSVRPPWGLRGDGRWAGEPVTFEAGGDGGRAPWVGESPSAAAQPGPSRNARHASWPGDRYAANGVARGVARVKGADRIRGVARVPDRLPPAGRPSLTWPPILVPHEAIPDVDRRAALRRNPDQPDPAALQVAAGPDAALDAGVLLRSGALFDAGPRRGAEWTDPAVDVEGLWAAGGATVLAPVVAPGRIRASGPGLADPELVEPESAGAELAGTELNGVGQRAGEGGRDGVRKRGVLRRFGAWAALPAATGALAAVVAGTGYLAFGDGHSASAGDLGRWVAAQQAAGAQFPAADPFRTTPVAALAPPSRLTIPAIGVNTALDQLHLGKDGTLMPPAGYVRAGWYADGTTPGDMGPAVIAGHVDSQAGPAVFYRLRELTAGDEIVVTSGTATLTFVVTKTAWYPKTAFPTATVYGPTPDSELRLITCGGTFDHTLRSYRDNLVVYAVAG